MARYIVEDNNYTKYEKNYKMPLINLIPAIVWCIPVHQKTAPIIGTKWAYVTVAVFLLLYIAFSYMPLIAVAPCVAGAIMLTAMLWAPADMIGNNVVRIIVKVIILLIVALIEFCIFGNATLGWLQAKTNKPMIRRVDD